MTDTEAKQRELFEAAIQWRQLQRHSKKPRWQTDVIQADHRLAYAVDALFPQEVAEPKIPRDSIPAPVPLAPGRCFIAKETGNLLVWTGNSWFSIPLSSEASKELLGDDNIT